MALKYGEDYEKHAMWDTITICKIMQHKKIKEKSLFGIP